MCTHKCEVEHAAKRACRRARHAAARAGCAVRYITQGWASPLIPREQRQRFWQYAENCIDTTAAEILTLDTFRIKRSRNSIWRYAFFSQISFDRVDCSLIASTRCARDAARGPAWISGVEDASETRCCTRPQT